MSWPLLHPAAEAELAEALDWYDERSGGLGERLYNAVDAALARIGQSPEIYPVWRQNIRFRRAVIRDFPYAVFYWIHEGRTVVVAVAHTRRVPGYWLNRVG